MNAMKLDVYPLLDSRGSAGSDFVREVCTWLWARRCRDHQGAGRRNRSSRMDQYLLIAGLLLKLDVYPLLDSRGFHEKAGFVKSFLYCPQIFVADQREAPRALRFGLSL